MIKQNPMIGWMLADASMAMLGIGALATACVIASWTPPSKLDSMSMELESYKLRDETTQLIIDGLTNEVAAAKRAAESAKAKTSATVRKEESVRQELLGLRGSMDRTFFVIDMSDSMNTPMQDTVSRPNWGGDGSPWSFVRNQVDAWIRYLPVQHYRMIAFNHEMRHFPETSRWANRQADSVATKQFLDALEPTGFTGTEQALRQAARWKPTNIVLITDGAPTGTDGNLEPAQAQAILELVASDEWNIPINVVAANNYFNPEFGKFLVNLAANSGGSFIGL